MVKFPNKTSMKIAKIAKKIVAQQAIGKLRFQEVAFQKSSQSFKAPEVFQIGQDVVVPESCSIRWYGSRSSVK